MLHQRLHIGNVGDVQGVIEAVTTACNCEPDKPTARAELESARVFCQSISDSNAGQKLPRTTKLGLAYQLTMIMRWEP